jgi:hypothetical protein
MVHSTTTESTARPRCSTDSESGYICNFSKILQIQMILQYIQLTDSTDHADVKNVHVSDQEGDSDADMCSET